MLVLGADEIRRLAPPRRVVEALREVFARGGVVAVRTPSPVPGDSPNRLFVSMLAMDEVGGPVIKLITIYPENPAQGLVTVQGAIVVFSETGAPTAILDGTIVTQLRTGAASALASDYLSRQDSRHLVIMGTGALAPSMAAAHCAVRPIERISVWGRSADKAAATVAAISQQVPGVEVAVTDRIEESVANADIVSCSTSSPTPILHGKWLRPGTHVDLVGAFQPTKRESDDEVVLRARIFVDTMHGAMNEAGDLLEPMSRGIIDKSRIEGQLEDLASGRMKGRRSNDEITLFKSSGTAIEDLAMARMVVEAAGAPSD
ncbi:bifunctional Delta(1)-pyrroline-2-carboxylate/Delta(1)-piperideine-2-carboxylate reductase [Sphingosinicella rhizophila]|uniref:Ornithine cyclodeaminase family protein n=1 Tax=Sphingosinicella rhizophila TaxID=3050082 RepID=A0ABU3Q6K0_9SPHN|nr:ornithine cyclodeaminase family protein [Sphingosinicella sp. GR2756]MDT9598714.1 ornithine cyclodeaminase family protein [Sphingosinicella sp. GR2756]